MLGNLIPVSLLASVLFTTAQAQLTGSVGPLTSLASKSKICSVLDYGGSIGSNDIGPAIQSAYDNCVTKNSGSTLYVPAGNYNMATWVTLKSGTKWAFRLDGFITRTATTGGHMVLVQNANDFEFYSANSKGGFQGNGYLCRNAGPRFIRMVTSTNWSLHDIIMVDSPEFHLVVQGGSKGEIYNMVIRGANIGGSDGIDISGDNHWVHDVEVSNRDECVTIKSPASNFLIERIWCNQSGGSAFGSLGVGTAISNIEYNNIYTNGGNQAMMIKGNGGSGYIKDVLLQNFISRGTAYGLYVNLYWSSMTRLAGNGVALSNIKFKNWNGNVVNGVQRSPLAVICDDLTPCTGISLDNVNMWSQTGSAVYKCESAYGTSSNSGVNCLKSGSGGGYAAVSVTATKPAGYTTPMTMAGDLDAGFPATAAIPVPASIPTSFFPGLPAYSKLMSAQPSTGGSAATTTAKTSTATTKATSTAGSGSGTAAHYGQCGGIGWTGVTACESPYTCTYSSDYYSQCL